jgi:RNA polymerase sigma-70 factor (ECF subfamily)
MGEPEHSAANATIYTDNVDALYAFVYSKVGHREVAQDLTADIFVKALALVDHTQSPAAIRSWLYHVARTTVADYWRSTLRARVIPLEEARDRLREPAASGDDTLPDARTTAGRAQRLLQRLPARYREVLVLRFVRGLSLREAASALGTTEGNVKVLQHRAICKARDLGLEAGCDGA